jgi:N-acetyl-beta-hexosaminidase
MATFAIVRADGSVDKVQGSSVEDVSGRYGAPGNGSIEAWDEGSHGSKLANTFDTVEEQLAAWKKVAESEGQGA